MTIAVGDEVCVMGHAFIERVRPLLNITAAAAEEIRDYHRLVATRFEAIPGPSIAAKLRTLADRMGEPTIPVERARYWVTLDDEAEKSLHDVVPHAPQDLPSFLQFMTALGVSTTTASRFWAWAVIAQRSVRMRVGLALYDAYRGILVDPHAAEAENFDRRADIKKVRSAADNFVAVVQAVRRFRG
jgi:hypothetical protein